MFFTRKSNNQNEFINYIFCFFQKTTSLKIKLAENKTFKDNISRKPKFCYKRISDDTF